MQELTRANIEAMADYLARSTDLEHKRDLNVYLSAPTDKKADILSALWKKYGHTITVIRGE